MTIIPLVLTLFLSLISRGASATEQARVLVLLDRGFNAGEFYHSALPLLALGYQVEIASPEGGTVFVRNDGEPDRRGRDWHADLRLDDVDPQRYVALLIPGGYSPGNLESHPQALDICRAFMARGVPIAAVCHGPRLLMRAGLLHDRVVTGLFNIPNECPQDWQDGAMGTYIDQAVVIDGNLITSRYPGDMHAFTLALIDALAARDGLPPLDHQARLALVVDGMEDQHARWALITVPRLLGSEVREIRNQDHLEAIGKDDDWQADVVLVLPNSQLDDEAVAALAPVTLRLDPVDHYPAYLSVIVAAIRAHGRIPEPQPTVPAEVLIAIAPGFDDAVVAGMQAVLAMRGQRVALVAESADAGWVRGLHGLTLWTKDRATVSPEQPVTIIAPGGFWATADAGARQADDAPPWVEERGQRDQERIAWLIERHDAGDTLVLFGLDALRLGRNQRFDGLRFATSTQVRWGFGRGAARFSDDPARRSADRLFTAASAATIPDVMRLIDEESDGNGD